MVRVWNEDPSKEQNGCGPIPPPPVKNVTFPATERFVRDGTTRTDRLPNFLNGADGQGGERSPSRRDVDTNTHTTYADRLASTRAVLALADAVEASLWSPPAMRSRRVKSATPRTLLSNDTRFEVLRDPYAYPIGPGHYYTEAGQPDMGTLPADLPSRSLSPGRDPTRVSAAFISPPRGRLWVPTEGGHLGAYQSASFMPLSDKAVPWAYTGDGRTPVADYRFSSRFSDARRELPRDAEYEAAAVTDAASRATRTADVAATSKASEVPFRTREPRLAVLPRERVNDTRLSRPRYDEEYSHLGPGAYTPLISIGGAKRTTYRLFASPQPNGTLGRGAVVAGTTASAAYARTLATGGAKGSGNAAFMSAPRAVKYGPHTWSTDSALTRTH